MKIIEEWHKYELDHLDWNWKTIIQFVNRWHSNDCEWINNQELIRVLIDRIKFLDNEKPWKWNNEIIKHLRKSFILHESRALERKVEKEEMEPENISVWKDWHFNIKTN